MKQMDCASHVVSTFFGDRVTSVVPIVGKGSVNSVFQVNTPHNRVVVRVNHHHYLLDYQKEAWCIKQAAQKAIPSPNVLAVGRYDDCAYMIESFIVGDNGDDSLVDQRYIWRKLGSYMKLIGSIPVKGFGEHLSDPETGAFVSPLHDGYDGTWSGFLDYNITSLTEHDPLIKLGVFTARDSRLIKQAFEKLRDLKFEFGLNHGDLSLKNTIVSPDRTVHLLDWGSAEVNVTPYGDLIQVLQQSIRMNRPNQSELTAFIQGYGLCENDLADMEPLLNSLLLLRAFDKLRWALDISPYDVNDFATYAHTIVMRLVSTFS